MQNILGMERLGFIFAVPFLFLLDTNCYNLKKKIDNEIRIWKYDIFIT
jgi:hypothetical protein